MVRVGVAVPRNPDKTVPEIEQQNRLAMALNQHKPDRNLQRRVQAVVLETGWGSHAIAEAKGKNCQFIIATQLTSLKTSSKLRPNGATDYDTVPLFAATVEYQLTRAVDGVVFATGSATVEDTSSPQEVVWQTLAEVAGKAIADMAKSGGVLPESPEAPNGRANSLPGQAGAAMISPSFCSWLPTGIPHGDVLPGVCEYVMSLTEKMPNFICHQEASRYRGNGRAPTDLITLSVRYEDGIETYSDIKVDGRPATIATAQATGLWSRGEFGSDNVRSIFDATNQPLFQFDREGAVGEHAAWIFTYQIAKQNDPLWRLHVGDQLVAPPYSGELWVDQKTGGVLRFESMAKDLPKSFPIKEAQQQIDYASVAFGDGSSFVLPVDFSILTVVGGEKIRNEKTRNVVRLTDCHKFRAKGRLVLSAESNVPGAASTAQIPRSRASVQADLKESEETFSAIREQEVQESETRREADQEQMLDAVTAATQQRLSQLREEQEKMQAQSQGFAIADAKGSADDAPGSRLRVNVRLVPVSVVLRDGAGHAVGNMGQDNFRLFDEGRPQMITQFSVETTTPNIPAERSAEPVRAEGAVPPAQLETSASHPAGTERATAYLFDDVHSNLGELANARDAAVRHLNSLKAGESVAVFTTSGAVAVDFTDDRDKLLGGLRKLKPRALSFDSDCPPLSYYVADLMVNKRDPDANSVAVAEVMDCAFQGSGGSSALAQRLATAKAVEVLDAGSAESKNALAVLRSVIRRTESMPGTRSIVVVSPGFFAITPDLLEDVMRIVEGAVHSEIIINALDAGGLGTPGVSGKSSLPGKDRFLFASAEAQARSDVMAEFASGTGGIFFHNNNNLDEGFRRTADAPEFVYVLGFSPQKLDGKFHRLKVTVHSASKLEVQARRGYYAIKSTSAN